MTKLICFFLFLSLSPTVLWAKSTASKHVSTFTIEAPQLHTDKQIWKNEQIFELVSSTTIPKTSKFHFLLGSEEGNTMVPDQNKMVSLLLKKGVNEENIRNRIVEGGEHNEAFWSSNFPQAFERLFQDSLN